MESEDESSCSILVLKAGLGANLVSIGCGIFSIAQVARSFPATALLPAVGIHWAMQAIGGRGGTLPVIQRLVETITRCPDPANSCPTFLSPCFLGSVIWLC